MRLMAIALKNIDLGNVNLKRTSAKLRRPAKVGCSPADGGFAAVILSVESEPTRYGETGPLAKAGLLEPDVDRGSRRDP